MAVVVAEVDSRDGGGVGGGDSGIGFFGGGHGTVSSAGAEVGEEEVRCGAGVAPGVRATAPLAHS